EPWERVLDDARAPLYRWFAGGRLNTCYNALDRHVERGRAEQTALVYDSPVTSTVSTYTYRELRDLVATFAGALARLGVERGDRVVIYMPMVPEAVIAMLACARLGAIHSVVFGGFAANELATRIDDAKPKIVVSASGGIEPGRIVAYKPLLDDAIAQADWKPERCVVLQRPFVEAALDPGRHIEWSDAGAFWRVIAEHGVSTLFTAPTAFRAIRQQDPSGEHLRRYDLSRFRTLFLAGERCDPETLGWAEEQLGVPVIDHYWQTETGWPVVANCIGIERLPVVPGSPTKPVPGWDLRVVDEDGTERPAGEIGPLVVKLPLPPGSSPTLRKADDRFRGTYLTNLPRYHETADAG